MQKPLNKIFLMLIFFFVVCSCDTSISDLIDQINELSKRLEKVEKVLNIKTIEKNKDFLKELQEKVIKLEQQVEMEENNPLNKFCYISSANGFFISMKEFFLIFFSKKQKAII